jgi:hypothetical protein
MALDDPHLDAMLRLAEWLADPASWLPGDPSVLPDDLRAEMAASPVLRPALNRWLARNSGLDRLVINPVDLDAHAIALLTAPAATQMQAARMLGAALWADRIRLALLKADRDRFAEQLGAEAIAFSLRRAVVFARPLTELGARLAAPDPVTAGRMLCAALLARAAPVLCDLFRLRHPDLSRPVPVTEGQAQAAWSVLALPGGQA